MYTKISINPNLCQRAYGIFCHNLFSQTEHNGLQGLGASYCYIESKGQTTPHAHHDQEIFIIQSGEGEIDIDGIKTAIKTGDVITVPPFSTHILSNTSDDRMAFISIYTPTAGHAKPIDQLFIQAAPATPNGPMHLGHLSGPYLAADVLNRYMRMQGSDVYFQCGTDDHQPYLALCNDIDQTIAKNTTRIQTAFELANIKPDIFLVPKKDSAYQNFISDLIDRMIKQGALVEKTATYLYCATCDKDCTDADVYGQCSHCNSQTVGMCCESCGQGFVPETLVAPHCQRCHTQVEKRTRLEWVLPMSHYQAALKQYYDANPGPAWLQDKINAQLLNPLPDFPIFSAGTHGFHYQGKPLHVWIEMAAGLLYGGQNKENWALCFGIDNQFYYTIVIPIMLIAAQVNPLPKIMMLTNHFLLLENEKFSTSRQHAIWADEFVTTDNNDWLRFYISSIRAETKESDFTEQGFNSFIQQVINEKLLRYIEHLNKTSPTQSTETDVAALSPQEKHLLQQLVVYRNKLSAHYHPNHFSLQMAAQILVSLLTEMKLFQDTAPQHGLSLKIQLIALKHFALMSYPIMPSFAKEILLKLNTEELQWPTDLDIQEVSLCLTHPL